MKPEEQNAAIAYAVKNECDNCGRALCRCREVGIGSGVPDYVLDLNAIHLAEKTLTDSEYDWFCEHLYDVVERQGDYPVDGNGNDIVTVRTLSATAAQRAEALLMAKGLWKNEA